MGETSRGQTCRKRGKGGGEAMLKLESQTVEIGKVNVGNKDHGKELEMTRDGGALLA